MTIERIPIDDRASWLELRKRDITASDVPIVCGEGLYGSTAQLFAEKKGLRPPQMDNDVLRRGRWIEPSIFEALAETYPQWKTFRAKIYLRDPALRLGCTPDGFALAPDHEGRGVVQAKSVAGRVFRERWLLNSDDTIEEGAIKPPNAYLLQTLTEMLLSQTMWGVIAVLVMKGEFGVVLRVYFVERNAAAEAVILERVDAFWRDHLDINVMPEFQPQKDEELIKALYPHDDGTEIDLTTDNRAARLVTDLIECQAAKKRLEDSIDEMKTELQAKLGEHTYGLLNDGRYLSWKLQHRRSYTVPPSHHRVFKIINARPKRKEDAAA
jgi:predicted phage-related endonuclease